MVSSKSKFLICGTKRNKVLWIVSVLVIFLFFSQIPFVEAQNSNEDDSDFSWGEIIGWIIGIVVVSVFAPLIKKRNTKKLLKHKELFLRPSFFVKKIKWTKSNITYAVLFDKERILFVHADKITKAPKESRVDEILNMSKHNFQILWEEVTNIEVNDSEEGINGIRAGELIFESKGKTEKFDIMYSQDFNECKQIIKPFWPPRGSLPKGYEV